MNDIAIEALKEIIKEPGDRSPVVLADIAHEALEKLKDNEFCYSEQEFQIINTLKNSSEDIFFVNDGHYSQLFFQRIVEDFNVSVVLDSSDSTGIIKIIRKDLDGLDVTHAFVRQGLLLNQDEIIIKKSKLTKIFEKELKDTFNAKVEDFNNDYVKISRLKNKTAFLYKETSCN